MCDHFNEILVYSFGSTSVSNPERNAFDKIIPFKVKIKLDILKLEGNIDTPVIDNWIQQLESYFYENQLFEVEKVTIESLNMSIFSTLLMEKYFN